jgi:hypothetical protein
MAHWAELDENNIVLRVTVGSNDEPDEGYGWLIQNLGGRWVQTSYNGNFRKRFAGVGDAYDEDGDVFISPQPFPSWSLDENYDWQPPVAKPADAWSMDNADGVQYQWNEESLSWVEVVPPRGIRYTREQVGG